MPNNYQPRLVQIRPQYVSEDRDVAENVLWWIGTFTSALTNDQAAATLAVFDPLWGALFEAYGDGFNAYEGSIITDWSSDTGIEYTSVGVFTPVNGGFGSVIGANTAALLSWSTALRFRGGHARSYLPYVGQDAIGSTTELDEGRVTGMNTAIVNLINGMEEIPGGFGGGYFPVMYKYRNAPLVDPPKPPVLVTITDGFANPILASQRRRLRKVSRRA